MNPKKITYTVSWTQHPGTWNIPDTVKLLEQARTKAIEAQSQLIEQQLAGGDFALANDLLHKIKAK